MPTPAPDPAGPGVPPVPPGRPRRLPAEWPLGLVTATLAAAVLLVATHHFRRGTALLAFAVLLAAGLRLVLPDRRSGLLRVRTKTVDVLTLVVLAAATGFLAVTVPLQH